MARVPMEPTMAAPAVGTGVGSASVSSAGGATTLVSVSMAVVEGRMVSSGEGSGTGVGSGIMEVSGIAEEAAEEAPSAGGFSQSLAAAGRTSSMITC